MVVCSWLETCAKKIQTVEIKKLRSKSKEKKMKMMKLKIISSNFSSTNSKKILTGTGDYLKSLTMETLKKLGRDSLSWRGWVFHLLTLSNETN
jgi:hypothetical protein